jgi:hypothetical protein
VIKKIANPTKVFFGKNGAKSTYFKEKKIETTIF